MDWRSHFTATWFDEWRNAQLEAPETYERRYDALRRTIAIPDDLLPSIGTSVAVAAPTVRDVYTFGHLIGQLAGRMLRVPDEELPIRAEWCGRFNLGISLFDYVSDEEGQSAVLASMPMFGSMSPDAPVDAYEPAVPRSDAAQALEHVAAGVLRRLEDVAGAFGSEGPIDPLWRAFADMMRAELLMAGARSETSSDIRALQLAARAKSAGPFACMAEWMALGQPVDEARRIRARALGTAIGECFWMVDDAVDLWDDLDRDRWNLFLLTVATCDPTVAVHPVDMDAEIRLSRILLARGWLRGLVRPVIARMRNALDGMPAPPATRQEATGLLAVAMQRWLCA